MLDTCLPYICPKCLKTIHRFKSFVVDMKKSVTILCPFCNQLFLASVFGKEDWEGFRKIEKKNTWRWKNKHRPGELGLSASSKDIVVFTGKEWIKVRGCSEYIEVDRKPMRAKRLLG